MRVFVTGCAGFIGSHFVRSLLARSDRPVTTVGYDLLTYAGSHDNMRDFRTEKYPFTFVQGDVRDRAALAKAMQGSDFVVHLAAESHVDRSLTGADAFLTTNILGTQNILEVAREVGVYRTVLVSTDEVYGDMQEAFAADEAFPIKPSSPYSAAKAAGDMLALAAHRSFGQNLSITRGSNTYGPYQFPEKLIPMAITRIQQGKPIPMYGEGDQSREWLAVEDHVAAIETVLWKGRPGEVYNIGSGTRLTNRTVLNRIRRLMGQPDHPIVTVADRPGHDRRYAIHSDKLQQLGWTPAPPEAFDGLLADTVGWYADHPEWLTRTACRLALAQKAVGA